jgi:hypothetical protein
MNAQIKIGSIEKLISRNEGKNGNENFGPKYSTNDNAANVAIQTIRLIVKFFIFFLFPFYKMKISPYFYGDTKINSISKNLFHYFSHPDSTVG